MRVKIGKTYQLVAMIDEKTGIRQVMIVTGLYPAFEKKYVEVSKCVIPTVLILKRVRYPLHGHRQTAYLVDFQCEQCYVLEWQLFREIKSK
jgi:hypothetical protein